MLMFYFFSLQVDPVEDVAIDSDEEQDYYFSNEDE